MGVEVDPPGGLAGGGVGGEQLAIDVGEEDEPVVVDGAVTSVGLPASLGSVIRSQSTLRSRRRMALMLPYLLTT
jgi:hypothetical protein